MIHKALNREIRKWQFSSHLPFLYSTTYSRQLNPPCNWSYYKVFFRSIWYNFMATSNIQGWQVPVILKEGVHLENIWKFLWYLLQSPFYMIKICDYYQLIILTKCQHFKANRYLTRARGGHIGIWRPYKKRLNFLICVPFNISAL